MREMQQGEREAIVYVYVYVYVYVFVDVMYVSSSCPYHTYQIQSTNLIHFFPSSRLVSSVVLSFMCAEGIQVMICTSPVITSVFSAEEKSSWVSHHLGPEWLDRLIITCR